MPNLIIHTLANIFLILIIANYEKFILKKKYNLKYIVLLVFSSQLIDLDHLFANPIYDPLRCGINFHPLHSWYVFPLYFAMSIWSKYKYFFWAVIFHLILDSIDCII